MEKLHAGIREQVEALKDSLFDISTFIFEHPELGDEERESCAYLTGLLKANGFTVTCPYKGVETAFRAELENGEGPTIAFLAEYDALPGYGPEQKPAHACGHNWIAATTVGAGLALSRMTDRFSGKVVVFGTPAEETTGRKIDLAQAGAFDDVDAAFQMHLSVNTNLRAKALAMNSAEFEFFGRAAHAAAYPEEGVNALDAVILTFNGVNALRQQLQSDVRIHGIITEGGKAANVIPDHCKCLFYVRAARKSYFLEVFEKVKDCARAAAMMTGAELKINYYENQYDDLQVNPVLAELMARHMAASGFEPLSKAGEVPSSTDLGNVSYRCPVLYGNVGIAEGRAVVHEEAFIPYVNGQEAHKRLLQTVESFIGSALELYDTPALVEEVHRVFRPPLPTAEHAVKQNPLHGFAVQGVYSNSMRTLTIFSM